VFAVGAAAIGVFMVGLLTGHSLRDGGGIVRAGSLTEQDEAEPLEASNR
jgi:nitric oxide reductase subunit B